MAATVERYKAGKSNWQTWHNAGLISVALCLRDEKLLDKVLNGDGGFYYQMENSVLSDGAWYEGSWSYHAYTLSAMVKIAEAAWHSGIDLYKTPELKKMFEAPFKCLMPNGKSPATNDGMEQGPSTMHCEIAAGRYGDPIFEDFIAKLSKRAGYEALFVGLENPKRHPNALSSAVMDASGLAFLRRGGQFVSLDFGPHGGGHGHRDKLAVNYFTFGRTVAPDPGRGWPYNLPIHREWYKMTLSHNTVVVDETPQKECEGKLESKDFTGDYHTATASVDTAYDGVTLRRTVALSDNWLLDIYEVESDVEHTYDWVWHGRGDFATGLANAPADMQFTQPSYSFLSNLRKGDGSKDWRATWKLEGGTVHGLFRGASDRDVILCDAPDNPRTDILHSIILRDKANKSVFVSLFSTKPMGWKDLPTELQELCRSANPHPRPLSLQKGEGGCVSPLPSEGRGAGGEGSRCELLDVPKGRKRVTISLVAPKTPEGDEKCRMWPVLATDIITQARFQLKDGRWTDWQPRNLLMGGDMADSDGDGIPDWASVMHLRESGNTMHADTSVSDWQPPVGDYWHGKTSESGRFVDRIEHPIGAVQSLRLTRGTSDGQDCAAMRLDLVPPDTDLTVCGWTRYDLGDRTSMGVMARFHEFDLEGNRVNKYVLLGDDDFHQPSGRSEWRWRALSFRSLPQTTFLNLYPIRMISAQGQARAANYEVRLGSVFSGSKRPVFREDFESLDRWEVSGPAESSGTLTLKPEPMKIVTATQKKPIEVKAGKLYAFRIAMQNDVPASYDKTHHAWMSAYLEFYDKDMKFLDYCKVMAFRPTLDRPAGAAMHAPEGSKYARFMLVASHICYDGQQLAGSMRATFDDPQLEESAFDPAFTPRPSGPISLSVPSDAAKMEVRSFLLSREKHLLPSLAGYDISWE